MNTHPPNRARRGALAIEFALVLPLLLALATAVIDYGWYLSRASRVVVATRDGARLGVTYSTDESPAPHVVAQQHARDALVEAGIPCADGCEVTATLGAVDGVPSLTLNVSAPFTPLTGLVPTPTEMRVELTMALEIRDPEDS